MSISSLGQKFTATCKEHDCHGSVEIQWFLQLLFFRDRKSGTQTTYIKKKKGKKKKAFLKIGWNHPQASGSHLTEFLTTQNRWN